LNLAKVKKLYFLHVVQICSEAHAASYAVSTAGSLLGSEEVGHEADHSQEYVDLYIHSHICHRGVVLKQLSQEEEGRMFLRNIGIRLKAQRTTQSEPSPQLNRYNLYLKLGQDSLIISNSLFTDHLISDDV
jgi:hypothetical protein